MNRKISLGISLGIMLIAMAVASIVTFMVVDKQYDTVVQGMPDKLQRYEIFDEVDAVVKENYYGSVDSKILSDALIGGYVEGLGDENSRYMTKKEYAAFKSEKQGNMSGIGIKYIRTSKNQIEVTRVEPASPAKNSGLKKGDIIVAFDGIKLTKKNYKEMTAKLESDMVSAVNIIYKRGDSEKSVTIEKGYEAQSATTGVYENIGYIEVTEFYSTTTDQIKSALDTFLASGIEYIVIDLRNNQSINYDNAVKALDLFVPMTDADRAAASMLDEKGNKIKSYYTTPGEINLPVAVLVSEDTASAAELFASGIRDFQKGEIFGCENTKGQALVQEVFELSTGSAVLLSVGKILPYSEVSFENTGLTPDYTTKASEIKDDFTQDKLFLYTASVLTN